MMKNFTYYRPTTVEQAVGLLENRFGSTEVLAGGTDLLDLQKEYIAQPGRIVSLNFVAGMSGIDVQQRAVKIGARATLSEIADHAAIKSHFPGLAAAAGEIGGPQIRNMGTLGGNLCQRNRCWYFRDEDTNCLLKGGERCFAIDGENRYHAVFTQGHRCVIVHPSTLAPMLVALGATAEISGPGGRRREIELSDFFKAPNGPNDREHNLAANEIVTSVTIPLRGLANASYEVRHRQSHDWPLVQAAVAFNREGGAAKQVRIVLGHVAPTPHLSEAAAAALTQGAIGDESIAAAGQAAARNAKPLGQNAYKLRLIEVAVKRAIITALGQKRYWEA